MLVLLAAYLVFGEFDESDPAQNGSGADSSTASQTADENNGLSENGATQFQAENTDEEELAKRYYYSQLDENRQMIYRELVQGIAEHQETIITKGGDPDVTAEVYGWSIWITRSTAGSTEHHMSRDTASRRTTAR